MRVCPRCKSKHVESDLTAQGYAQGMNSYRCLDCDFQGQFFLEIDDQEKKSKK